MVGSTRASAPAGVSRKDSMRPPARPSAASRTHSTMSTMRMDRSGAASPADSVASIATTATTGTSTGTKRKDREFDMVDEETNINVVVRCRGRNEREVRENSGVVLKTEGVRGKSLELSMGPNALSNKTYTFDKVFSAAADQSMIYDDVVTPILDEMLAGYNCTIFAYGQTGTGKTYTMSGDMSDHFGLLSDAAGIIPRALHALFTKLELDGAESSVKVSFIELYNEELRDLIAPDDSVKLKIYEDTARRGQASTLVHGMEESHIKSATEGIKILQAGSFKRQVAATKCNDLSSRSHTVFTVTVHVKRTSESGEDFVSTGKLNLVDLAGSENIQRSGAENKRAAEAGLINKSLLTLGRVINALVERTTREVHIPYRESKLTRLLQDSLGGQTKTCIIATVSPAKSNLEETISTLDYAFRAKNIRNKPQVNQMINKKTMLREFTGEIEKLKAELIATRQRNGVYLTNENYEEITVQSESRRILNEEQAAKIETMECNLRNKVQELYSLTTNFMTLKKDHESTKSVLDDTKSVLEQTESVLADTRRSLEDESLLRRAHQHTEEQFRVIGTELLSTLNRTVTDVDELHAKNRRRSLLHAQNHQGWTTAQNRVSHMTSIVEQRVEAFKLEQQSLIKHLGASMHDFVREELSHITSAQLSLKERAQAITSAEANMTTQSEISRVDMDTVLDRIVVLREDVKNHVAQSLQGLTAAAERISADVIGELGTFNTQLHSSYSSLGKDFKSIFEELLKHLETQNTEVQQLRQQLDRAGDAITAASITASEDLHAVLREEKEQAAVERQELLLQITQLINKQGAEQDRRLQERIGHVDASLIDARASFVLDRQQHDQSMQAWDEQERKLVESVMRSRESLKTKLKDDWTTVSKYTARLQSTTKSVHSETVAIVDTQMKDISEQMQALDDFVTSAKAQNAIHQTQRAADLAQVSHAVQELHDSVGSRLMESNARVEELESTTLKRCGQADTHVCSIDDNVVLPLTELRELIADSVFEEYNPTGQTPQKMAYLYPTELPATEKHEILIAGLRDGSPKPNSTLLASSPSKSSTIIFHDAVPSTTCQPHHGSSSTTATENSTSGLREIDANISAGGHAAHLASAERSGNIDMVTSLVGGPNHTAMLQPTIVPNLKRSVGRAAAAAAPAILTTTTTTISTGKLPGAKAGTSGASAIKKASTLVAAEGRENVNPANAFGLSVGGRRRSPRSG